MTFAFVLGFTAIVALAGSGRVLWVGLRTWDPSDTILRIIDGYCSTDMGRDLAYRANFHSISRTRYGALPDPRPHATIRRMLVITLDAANLTRPEMWVRSGEAIFHASVIEVGLLEGLVPVLVIAIYLLRRIPPVPEEGLE